MHLSRTHHKTADRARDERRRFSVALILFVFLCTAFPCRAQTVYTVFEMPTYGDDIYYVIDADDSANTSLRGLAVDDGGKIYLSDEGSGEERAGAIFLLQGTNKPARIIQHLNKPGDIALTPDQRGLVIARAGGGVDVRYFGVTVRILNDGNQFLNVRMFLITDWGPIPAEWRNDGYYHFPDVMRPGQNSTTATLVINNLNPPQAYEISLTDPETGELTGHAFVELLLEE